VRRTAEKAGLALDEIDFFLFTQLNLNTIKEIMGILEQPLEKTLWIMDKGGYTGSACTPMALDNVRENRNWEPEKLRRRCDLPVLFL
jgi:3-oxoacyl-[acyl-carrier-protein] synthase-3